jgi:hypothetical protein
MVDEQDDAQEGEVDFVGEDEDFDDDFDIYEEDFDPFSDLNMDDEESK